MVHSHVGDFLIAQRTSSSAREMTISSLEKKLYLKRVEGIIEYCGLTIEAAVQDFRNAQATAASAVDFVEFAAGSRNADDRLAPAE
eukprot:8512359-Pyramimonas_sp.AAC.1